MNKTLIASCGAIATIGTVAAIGIVPTSAATGDVDAWHEVQVTADPEIELGGAVSKEVVLSPTVTGGVVSNGTGTALSVRSNVNWKLQYQAVEEEYTDKSKIAGGGTSLGATGFVSTGGYTYSGADTAAGTTGNTWGVQFAMGGSGATSAVTALTAVGLTNVATGTPTATATVTPTYSAHTDGTITAGTYYGTIYYNLSAL